MLLLQILGESSLKNDIEMILLLHVLVFSPHVGLLGLTTFWS